MKDSHDPIVYSVMYAIRKLTRSTLMHQHSIAQSMELNVTDAECIDFLQDIGPSTAGDLAKITGLTTGSVTAVIDRLAKKGYVRRSSDPQDRRKVMVSVLPEKLKASRNRYKELANQVNMLLRHYKKNELKLLLQFTEQLTAVYVQQSNDKGRI
jgi:MarR family transcriptional regulator, organic hydroperoxide resistance regulator